MFKIEFGNHAAYVWINGQIVGFAGYGPFFDWRLKRLCIKWKKREKLREMLEQKYKDGV